MLSLAPASSHRCFNERRHCWCSCQSLLHASLFSSSLGHVRKSAYLRSHSSPFPHRTGLPSHVHVLTKVEAATGKSASLAQRPHSTPAPPSTIFDRGLCRHAEDLHTWRCSPCDLDQREASTFVAGTSDASVLHIVAQEPIRSEMPSKDDCSQRGVAPQSRNLLTLKTAPLAEAFTTTLRAVSLGPSPANAEVFSHIWSRSYASLRRVRPSAWLHGEGSQGRCGAMQRPGHDDAPRAGLNRLQLFVRRLRVGSSTAGVNTLARSPASSCSLHACVYVFQTCSQFGSQGKQIGPRATHLCCLMDTNFRTSI